LPDEYAILPELPTATNLLLPQTILLILLLPKGEVATFVQLVPSEEYAISPPSATATNLPPP